MSARLRYAAALAVLAVLALAASGAGASVQYDLTGTWDTYGAGGGYSGTFTISSMNLATGAFSGTGDGGTFALQGTETGTSVAFTQSEGSYVAHDAATLQLSAGKLEMTNGTWS
ncbi:MAG TPA: hypothetical protein VL977_01105, partial [Solirubrobacteraceae bacterium]|nr:hypothetical protein [Solirubrobacteraceae bacterium]